jgi:hypothetical protein
MINVHEFNTRWWGKPVGIVTDAQFFTQRIEDQREQLAPYDWAEFAGVLPEGVLPADVLRAGFFHADTHVQFRLDLRQVTPPQCSDELTLESAESQPFSIDLEQMALFRHERFLQVPGATLESVSERYALWSADLIAASPGTCLRAASGGVTQGWFLSRVQEGKLNLTLAMLSRNASLPGATLYRAACHAYGERGHRIGYATFSVSNAPVHNIYAQMGARFLEPRHHWLWIRTV